MTLSKLACMSLTCLAAFFCPLSLLAQQKDASQLSAETKRELRKPGNERIKPFSSVTIGGRVGTLGAGIQLSTPLSRAFTIRGGLNLTGFSYAFDIDGVNYDSQLNLRSSDLSLDWYPFHKRFHISPGVLYANNKLSAITSVPPGNYFELGSAGFINSVDDPLNGEAHAYFPRRFSPMLTIGLENLLPGKERRLTIPVNIGVAYTGAAMINVALNGTACTSEGCFTFATNPDALESLKEEVATLNEDLKKVPVYPIASVGIAYRF
jgi:hypothetical protein